MIHDPRHVAQLAAVILSSRPEPEAHHIKAAVGAARAVLDEAHRRAEDDEVAHDSARASAGKPEDGQGAENSQGQGAENPQ